MKRDQLRSAILPTLLLALAGAMIILLVQSTEWVEVKVPREQPGPETFDPDYRLSRILHRLDVPALRFDHFEGLPPRGTTLLLRGWKWQSFPDIDQQILDWVEGGGQLVVPLDGFSGDPLAKPVWLPVSRLRKRGGPHQPEADSAPAPDAQAKAGDCARLREFPPEATSFPAVSGQGVDAAADADSDGDSADESVDTLLLCKPGADSTQTWIRASGAIWSLGVSSEFPRSVRVALGAGTVTATQDADVFRNASLLQGENTLIALALLQARPGHPIWIVDGSGGLGLAAWIWREAYPAVLLAALAVLAGLWRMAPRFGRIEAPPPLARRSVREQVRGTSLFLWRAAPVTLLEASARALDEAARRRIPAYDGADIEARIAALARHGHSDPRVLRSALPQTAGVTDRRDLARRLGVLESVRRNLMQREV